VHTERWDAAGARPSPRDAHAASPGSTRPDAERYTPRSQLVRSWLLDCVLPQLRNCVVFNLREDDRVSHGVGGSRWVPSSANRGRPAQLSRSRDGAAGRSRLPASPRRTPYELGRSPLSEPAHGGRAGRAGTVCLPRYDAACKCVMVRAQPRCDLRQTPSQPPQRRADDPLLMPAPLHDDPAG